MGNSQPKKSLFPVLSNAQDTYNNAEPMSTFFNSEEEANEYAAERKKLDIVN